jgi:hypothetical protein
MKKNKMDMTSSIELLTDDDVTEELGEAVASIMLNPTVTWAKFTLTDDLPNGNKQRVPLSEFDNLIKSGLHMPLKMAEGRPNEGHEDSKPLGVITHLRKIVEDGVNKIVALAALWSRERPEDVVHIKDLIESEDGVNVSWEILYGDSMASEGGVRDLIDTVLKAVTIVTRPAYQGRTKFLAVAAKAKSWSKAFVENLPDSSFLVIDAGGDKDSEGKTFPRTLRHFPIKDETGLISQDRLDKVMTEISESNLPQNTLKVVRKTVKALSERLEAGASLEEISFGESTSENINTEEVNVEELEKLKQELAELKVKHEAILAQLAEKETALSSLDEEKKGLETEVTSLREFKSNIEAEEAKATKLVAIKTKFADAGLEKTEEYFAENEKMLLDLDESALEFMVQELAAFSKNTEASLKNPRIPNIPGERGEDSITEMVKALRERKAKK